MWCKDKTIDFMRSILGKVKLEISQGEMRALEAFESAVMFRLGGKLSRTWNPSECRTLEERVINNTYVNSQPSLPVQMASLPPREYRPIVFNEEVEYIHREIMVGRDGKRERGHGEDSSERRVRGHAGCKPSGRSGPLPTRLSPQSPSRADRASLPSIPTLTLPQQPISPPRKIKIRSIQRLSSKETIDENTFDYEDTDTGTVSPVPGWMLGTVFKYPAVTGTSKNLPLNQKSSSRDSSQTKKKFRIATSSSKERRSRESTPTNANSKISLSPSKQNILSSAPSMKISLLSARLSTSKPNLLAKPLNMSSLTTVPSRHLPSEPPSPLLPSHLSSDYPREIKGKEKIIYSK